MLKILAIGNSFSCDCTEYLYKIASSAGCDIKVGNLYIGGCSLERHMTNIKSAFKEYEYFVNALSMGQGFSVNDVIRSDDWDIVTIQQASHYSGIIDTYYPYVYEIRNFIMKNAPSAKIYINQTWAYESDSKHSAFPDYECNQTLMYERLCNCYDTIAKELNVPIIPVGDVIQKLRSTPEFDYIKTGRSLCRDGFHLDLFYGRYAAAAVWFKYLAGGDVLKSTFIPEVFCKDDGNTASCCLDVINKTVSET